MLSLLKSDHKSVHSNLKEFQMKNRLLTKFRKQNGITMIEYALMAAVVALVLYVGFLSLGTTISAKFVEIGSSISSN